MSMTMVIDNWRTRPPSVNTNMQGVSWADRRPDRYGPPWSATGKPILCRYSKQGLAPSSQVPVIR